MHQHIGFSYVALHQGKLKFHSPQDLLPKLSGLKNQQTVLRLLRQSLPLNIECLANGVAQPPSACDRLQKEPIYLIYDPAKETVNLFIARIYFKKPTNEQNIEFIQDSTAGLSYMNKLGAAGSFSNGAFSLNQIYPVSPNYYNFYSNNVVAAGDNSLIGNLSQNNGLNNGQRFQIQNLYLQRIARDKIYTGGYIANLTSPFVQTQIIAGLGMQTTLATVKNTDNITATPLVIFVPQASQISIFKNGQLIFSEYLAAGYQTINTNNFPDGGYELTIKIGSANTINRFFTKGVMLPPIQAPQYYVIAGYLTNEMLLNSNAYTYLPTVLNVPVVQTGLNKRINANMALFSDVLLDSHQGYLDIGSTFFLGNSFIKMAGLITTKGNYGFYTMFNAQKERWNFNTIATKIVYQQPKATNFFVDNLIDNDSASISYMISQKDLLGIQTNYNRQLAQPGSYGAGSYYQHLIANYNGAGFFFNASYNRATNIGNSYYLGLSIQFSKGQLSGTEALLWQNQSNATGNNQLAQTVVAQGNTVYSKQNDMGIGYALNETHTISPSVTSVAGIYDITTQHGFASSYFSYARNRGEHQTIGYGGTLETELALNQNGVSFNGVERWNTSGITVRVNLKDNSANAKFARFALLDANNHKISVFPANKNVFISLPGFIDQNYTLQNVSNMDYHIKEPIKHVTLYPGNIGHYSWQVDKRLIVIGRALTKDRRHPVANTWIHAAKNGVFSDEEGYFQLELAQRTTQLTAESDEVCHIHLPLLKADEAYLYLGEILCS